MVEILKAHALGGLVLPAMGLWFRSRRSREHSSCDITVVVESTRLYGFDSKTNGAYCRDSAASRTITWRPLPTSTRLSSTRAGGSKRPSIAAMSRSVLSVTC